MSAPTMARLGQDLPRPGLRWGSYPQRPVSVDAWSMNLADHVGESLQAAWVTMESKVRSLWGAAPSFGDRVLNDLEVMRLAIDGVQAMTSAQRHIEAEQLQALIRASGLQRDLHVRAQALVAWHIEQAWGQRAFAHQHQAAWAMAHEHLVEMATGEGKSLAMVLAAGVLALGGVPVHVVTANDYLAKRDAHRAGQALKGLGLRVGQVHPDLSNAQRRDVYAAEVVFATARELGFDALRDQEIMVQKAKQVGYDWDQLESLQVVGRGLCQVLIDEADAVLLDHASTPLILARAVAPTAASADLSVALAWAKSLQSGLHCEVSVGSRQVPLTMAGAEHLRASLSVDPAQWAARVGFRQAEDWVQQALVALHGLKRDRDYLVEPATAQRPSSITLIDDTTGRRLPGTVWSREWGPLVALKEGVSPPPSTQTLSQLTLQALFARYWRVGGVSGTLMHSRWELRALLRRSLVRVEPRLPSQRKHLGVQVFAREADVHRAVLEQVRACQSSGQPVLIGTGSVAHSARLHQHLTDHGCGVALLNAQHDAHEAELMAEAGRHGAVTVSTNMAGRGTDIVLTPQALAAGGLLVISTHLNASARIDRQLAGRAARQGQAGASIQILALDQWAIVQALPKGWAQMLLQWLASRPSGLPAASLWARLVQTGTQWSGAHARWQMVIQGQRLERSLNFAREGQRGHARGLEPVNELTRGALR